MNVKYLSIGLLILLQCFISCERNNNPTETKIKQTFSSPVDSILIDDHYQVFYINSNTNSQSHKNQAKLARKDEEIKAKFTASFFADLQKKTNTELKKHSNITIPRKWAQAHKYKGEFFLYSSNNLASKSALYITDSTIHRIGPNMLTCSLIKSISYPSNNRINIETRNNSQLVYSIQIEPIQSNEYVYSWKYLDKYGGLFHQEFMVPFENIKELRMIVNDCFQTTCLKEFKFD